MRQEKDWTLQRAGAGGRSVVQREPKAPATRINVAIVLSDKDPALAEAKSLASTVLRVTSPEDARDKLKALGKPIATLFVVSHSNPAGDVEFTSSIGTVHLLPIAKLGRILRQGFAADMEPDAVDFTSSEAGRTTCRSPVRDRRSW